MTKIQKIMPLNTAIHLLSLSYPPTELMILERTIGTTNGTTIEMTSEMTIVMTIAYPRFLYPEPPTMTRSLLDLSYLILERNKTLNRVINMNSNNKFKNLTKIAKIKRNSRKI